MFCFNILTLVTWENDGILHPVKPFRFGVFSNAIGCCGNQWRTSTHGHTDFLFQREILFANIQDQITALKTSHADFKIWSSRKCRLSNQCFKILWKMSVYLGSFLPISLSLLIIFSHFLSVWLMKPCSWSSAYLSRPHHTIQTGHKPNVLLNPVKYLCCQGDVRPGLVVFPAVKRNGSAQEEQVGGTWNGEDEH